MHYSNSVTVTRGCNIKTRAEIELGPGEFITTIKGCVVGPLLAGLKFVTNNGTVRPFTVVL